MVRAISVESYVDLRQYILKREQREKVRDADGRRGRQAAGRELAADPERDAERAAAEARGLDRERRGDEVRGEAPALHRGT